MRQQIWGEVADFIQSSCTVLCATPEEFLLHFMLCPICQSYRESKIGSFSTDQSIVFLYQLW